MTGPGDAGPRTPLPRRARGGAPARGLTRILPRAGALALLAGQLLVAAEAPPLPSAPEPPVAPIAASTSAYLARHAHDRIPWMPWGAEALARASREHRPILLVSGFAACHWCHVLDRESFSDPAFAAAITAHFIPVLVDREEQPAVDSFYSAVLTAQTGQSGWPLIEVLAPDRTPLAGSTYLPKAQLLQALTTLAERWEAHDPRLVQASAQALTALVPPPLPAGEGPTPAALVESALAQASARFDAVDGGFGAAPKFPQPLLLELLLRPETGEREHTEVFTTLDHLLGGTIHDLLGGGFHRYCVDAAWRMPHFEKLLIDQAQLTLVLLHASERLPAPDLRTVAEATLIYCDTRLRLPSGAYVAGEDADSPLPGAPPGSAAVEGGVERWRWSELTAALAPLGARAQPALALLAHACALHEQGNVPAMFDDGTYAGCNLLRLAHPAEEAAPAAGVPVAEAPGLLQDALAALAHARASRVQPPRDETVLVGWNAVMLRAWAELGALTGSEKLLDRARRLAVVLTGAVGPKGLTHALTGPAVPATTLDTAEVIQGLLALHEAVGDPSALEWALALQEQLDATCWDDTTATYREGPPTVDGLTPPRQDEDGAEGAANSLAAANLVRLARLTGDPALTARATRLLATYRRVLAHDPLAMPAMVAAMAAWGAPGRRVLIVGDDHQDRTQALLAATWQGPWHPDRMRLVLPVDRRPYPHLAALPLPALPSPVPVAVVAEATGSWSAPITSPLVLRDRAQP